MAGLLSALVVGLVPLARPVFGNAQRLDSKRHAQPHMQSQQKNLLVLGGGGFAGAEICRNAVRKGFKVTSLTRRGENPKPDDPDLSMVNWIRGDATDRKTVKKLVDNADAVVHAVGVLFDANTGFLQKLSPIVSGSNSQPGPDSTYDNLTRKTALIVLDSIKQRLPTPFAQPIPVVFVSCAEAGWPEVTFGEQIDAAAPEWLQRYLAAKRAVEGELEKCDRIRPIILRPSFIWTWTKLDILPVIPLWNTLAAVGVPFIDKTVRVETLAKAAVTGLCDASVSGPQRVGQMESLAARLEEY